jgi:flavin-dependent dehydrogenase
MAHHNVGIIGAGPAGAWLAARLAKAGAEVFLFDHRAPWAKPCAGGMDPLIWREFPALEPLKTKGYPNQKVRIVTVRGDKLDINLPQPIYTLPRMEISQWLVDFATAAGAKFSREKITDFRAIDRGFALQSDGKEVAQVDFLVGADGAASMVRRRFCPDWPKSEFCFAINVPVHEAENLPVIIQFFPGLDGYVWFFPGKGISSFGIGSRAGDKTPDELFSLLERTAEIEPVLAALKPRLREDARKALIPALHFSVLRRQKVAGENWALVGDAAGTAHPVSGEGIYQSLKSADLLAEAILSGHPENYQSKWWGMCKRELVGPSLWGDWFYSRSMQDYLAGKLVKSVSARKIAVALVSCSRPARKVLLADLIRMLFGG